METVALAPHEHHRNCLSIGGVGMSMLAIHIAAEAARKKSERSFSN
jgi:hypothetical protein